MTLDTVATLGGVNVNAHYINVAYAHMGATVQNVNGN